MKMIVSYLTGPLFLAGSILAQGQTSLLTGNESYRTLESDHIKLRYPLDHEYAARHFLTQAEDYVTHLESRIGYKYPRDIVVFLTARRFPNAYVTGTLPGIDSHILLPLDLIYSDLFMAGFSGSAFDIFVHELAHHAQLEMGRGFFNKILGPLIPFDFIMTPSWVWEGYAVYQESTIAAPFKGRQRTAFFGALLQSALKDEKRDLVPFDFYTKNRDWIYSGASPYLIGSTFIDFLGRNYGDAKVNEFIRRTSEITFSSDLKHVFGKSFRELLADLNQELRDSPAQAKVDTQRSIYFDHSADLEALTPLPNGNTLVWESKEDNSPRVLLLSPEGKILNEWSWKKVLRSLYARELSAPVKAHASLDGREVYFHSYAPSRDQISIDGVFASFNVESGSLRILRSEATSTAAFTDPSSGSFWLLKKSRPKSSAPIYTLELGELAHPNAPLKVVATLSGPEQISGFSLSPDLKTVALSAYVNNNWDLFLLDLNSAQTSLKMLTHTPSQELMPQWVDRSLYYLSDDSGRYNVKQIDPTRPEESCQLSQAPWLVKDFNVSAARQLQFVQREGRFWSVDTDNGGSRACKKISNQSPSPVAEIAQAPGESYRESPFKVFWPVTRVLLPVTTYDSSGVGFLLAGESPYKKFSWNLAGFIGNLPRENNFQAMALYTGLEPNILALTFRHEPGYLYSERLRLRDESFSTTTLTLMEPLYNHTFEFSPVHRRGGGEEDQFGTVLAHSFESASIPRRSAGARKGLILSESVSLYPDSWGNRDPLNIYNFEQNLYLPLTFSSRDSFRIKAEQFYVDRKSRGVAGMISGPSLIQDYAWLGDRLSLESTKEHARITVLGLGDLYFRGNRAWGSELSYKFALGKQDYGTQHVWDRLWWNPRITNLRAGPFIAGAQFVGGENTNNQLHATTGATFEFQWTLFEFLPFQTMVYGAQRLTDDKKSDFGGVVGLYLDF